MTPVGFEPTISAGERPQTYALDRAASGTGRTVSRMVYYTHKYLISGHVPLSDINLPNPKIYFTYHQF
jgi:hypothetical protein